MNHRRNIALLCAALGALPAAAQALPTGGTRYGALAQSGSHPARHAVLLGHSVAIRGRVVGAAGRTIAIERRAGNGPWRQATTAASTRSGAFVASWRTDQPGRFALRAVIAGHEPVDGGARAATVSALREVTVLRRSTASWFGPGFFGRRTACGRKLTRRLLGVAHRSLPCGARVALLYKGRTLTVPVVDRGPFRPGVDVDLTFATARALRFTGFGPIGAIRVG